MQRAFFILLMTAAALTIGCYEYEVGDIEFAYDLEGNYSGTLKESLMSADGVQVDSTYRVEVIVSESLNDSTQREDIKLVIETGYRAFTKCFAVGCWDEPVEVLIERLKASPDYVYFDIVDYEVVYPDFIQLTPDFHDITALDVFAYEGRKYGGLYYFDSDRLMAQFTIKWKNIPELEGYESTVNIDVRK